MEVLESACRITPSYGPLSFSPAGWNILLMDFFIFLPTDKRITVTTDVIQGFSISQF